MRPYGAYSTTQPYTHTYINDAFNEIPTSMPTPRVTRFPTAVLGLALGIGLALLAMLGTWLSLSTQATDRATTFIVHSEGQTLSADELEGMGIPPPFLEDILTRF
jgi:hypothetical protein